jgi:hypothetical protein
MQDIKFLKKYTYLLLLLFATITFAQNRDNTSREEITLPADFFDNMFRSPSEDFLVAWHGGVKIAKVPFPESREETPASVQPLVKFLNKGYNEIFDSHFSLNMKDGKKQLVSPNGAIWAARCGLKSGSNINISTTTGKEIKGFPADITADVWAKTYTVKKSHIDSETQKPVLEIFRIEATSIYYHHLKKTDLKGKSERSDDYKLCGEMLFQRMGPGLNGDIVESVRIMEGEYDFKEQLTRGDYQVSFMWPHGNRIIVDEDFVYNPTNPEMNPDFNIPMYEGSISGKVVYKESDEPATDYPVKLIPVCVESGLPQHETTTDAEGEYIFEDIPEGEYYVMVEGAEDVEAFLTDPTQTKIEPKNSEISFNYDIYVTYNAPGFAQAKLVWRKSKISFPADDNEIQFFDMVAYRNSGALGEPTGTDGKPLKIPYTTVIPGIGKQTLYGWPESEAATPEVISVSSLGGNGVFAAFKVSLEEDALNTCNISQIGSGPIYFDINFDLTGRYPDSTVWQQVDVGSREDEVFRITGGGSLNGYPVSFKQLKFTNVDIEKFKKAEEFQKTLTNGGASLLIEFNLSEKE